MNKFLLALALALCFSGAFGQSDSGSFPLLKGPYLGQTPPDGGRMPFAVGIVPQSGLHTPPVFSPDGTEAYWKRSGVGTISMMKYERGAWTAPREISLSPSLSDYRDPCLSPDGTKLFFLSKGRLPFQEKEKENIWLSARSGTGWSEPRALNEGINLHKLHWQVSVASNGNLYFASFDTGVQDIYCAKIQGGDYQKPQRLGVGVNQVASAEWSPYVSPDEEFLLFARADVIKGSYGSYYIYFSGKTAKGDWSQAKKVEGLGVNVLCPQLSPDGKYLFFMGPGAGGEGGRSYWISSRVIEGLRKEAR